jgi:hypothetical protein
MAADNTPDEARLASLRKKSVFDFMLNDIKRAHTALAASERNKLDEYLSSIRALESRRSTQLEGQVASTVTCDSSAVGALNNTTLEDGIEGHFKVATMALVCGLTQVVTISPGLFWMYYRKIFKEPSKAHSWGHNMDSTWGIESYNKVHQHVATQIAGMADGLSAAKEGDKSILDNTSILWLNDAGMDHHGKHGLQPAVLLGNAGGALRADGRYLAFPTRGDPRPEKAQSLADLFITLSHALGVPNDDFGKGSNALAPIKGVIKQLV